MEALETVVFDMDGVLIDSEPLHVEVEQEVLAYSSVRAVAAYGVASEHGEEEVMCPTRLPTRPKSRICASRDAPTTPGTGNRLVCPENNPARPGATRGSPGRLVLCQAGIPANGEDHPKEPESR